MRDTENFFVCLQRSNHEGEIKISNCKILVTKNVMQGGLIINNLSQVLRTFSTI
jgi:hypothetical protein